MDPGNIRLAKKSDLALEHSLGLRTAGKEILRILKMSGWIFFSDTK